MKSTEAYTAAAAASALAVLLMWRHLRSTREATFVTNSPALSMPDWQRPLPALSGASKEAEAVDLPDVAIDDYDSLMAAEILPSLETLSVEELQAIVSRERMGLQRQGVITRAQKLIDLTNAPEVVPAADVYIDTSAVETSKPKRLGSKRKAKAAEISKTELIKAKQPKKETLERSDPDLSL